jgi:hypothetical protein
MFDFSNDSIFTKYIAAGSPFTPEIVLMSLADDSEPSIRRRIAENPKSPLDILNKLLCDDSTEVRTALIDNPALPSHMLELLLRDPNPDVRYALAECPTIPERILLGLLRDENPYVASRATRTYNNLHPQEAQMYSMPTAEHIDIDIEPDQLESRSG